MLLLFLCSLEHFTSMRKDVLSFQQRSVKNKQYSVKIMLWYFCFYSSFNKNVDFQWFHLSIDGKQALPKGV